MRTLLAVTAAAWFTYLAITVEPTFAGVRDLSIGLALISLAVVEWGRVRGWVESFFNSAEPRYDGGRR